MSAQSPVKKTEAIGLSDEEFLRQFETCTLRYVHWTHRAHLRVAYLYVTHFGLDGAIPKVTAGIRAYNQSQNIVDTPTSGYHETMTVAWLHIVAAALAACGPVGGAEQFLEMQPQFQKDFLLRFYSPQCLGSPEAKYSFVMPDLATLPSAPHS